MEYYKSPKMSGDKGEKSSECWSWPSPFSEVLVLQEVTWSSREDCDVVFCIYWLTFYVGKDFLFSPIDFFNGFQRYGLMDSYFYSIQN